ncbi:uncharacterized protein LOC136768523 isoform X2 [Amia ocellicauda]|uniref:uncharacterized protein LOC136768523 isoform X2 n=1 Tax=Amia ocellicauda TaxID=2972642 RepID=UPI003464990A
MTSTLMSPVLPSLGLRFPVQGSCTTLFHHSVEAAVFLKQAVFINNVTEEVVEGLLQTLQHSRLLTVHEVTKVRSLKDTQVKAASIIRAVCFSGTHAFLSSLKDRDQNLYITLLYHSMKGLFNQEIFSAIKDDPDLMRFSNREQFVGSVTNEVIEGILQDMYDEEDLSKSEVQAVRRQRERRSKAERLFELVWNEDTSESFCAKLKCRDPILYTTLQLNSAAGLQRGECSASDSDSDSDLEYASLGHAKRVLFSDLMLPEKQNLFLDSVTNELIDGMLQDLKQNGRLSANEVDTVQNQGARWSKAFRLMNLMLTKGKSTQQAFISRLKHSDHLLYATLNLNSSEGTHCLGSFTDLCLSQEEVLSQNREQFADRATDAVIAGLLQDMKQAGALSEEEVDAVLRHGERRARSVSLIDTVLRKGTAARYTLLLRLRDRDHPLYATLQLNSTADEVLSDSQHLFIYGVTDAVINGLLQDLQQAGELSSDKTEDCKTGGTLSVAAKLSATVLKKGRTTASKFLSSLQHRDHILYTTLLLHSAPGLISVKLMSTEEQAGCNVDKSHLTADMTLLENHVSFIQNATDEVIDQLLQDLQDAGELREEDVRAVKRRSDTKSRAFRLVDTVLHKQSPAAFTFLSKLRHRDRALHATLQLHSIADSLSEGISSEGNTQKVIENAVLFTPEIQLHDRKENYRWLSQSAGRFQCSVTGLVFEMSSAGEVLYWTTLWDMSLLTGTGRQPAGPLFDIRCPQGTIKELWLPHCEIFSDTCDFLAVAHVTGDNVEVLQPLEVTETHVRVSILGLSLLGLIMSWISPTVHGQVLLFLRPGGGSRLQQKLNVFLLPRNVLLSQCETFDYDYDPNFHPTFEVFLDSKETNLKLKLLNLSAANREVWSRKVQLTEWSQTGPISSASSEPVDKPGPSYGDEGDCVPRASQGLGTQRDWTFALSNIIDELKEMEYKRMLMFLNDLPTVKKEKDRAEMPAVIISHYGLEKSVTVIQEVLKKIPRNDDKMLNLLKPFAL